MAILLLLSSTNGAFASSTTSLHPDEQFKRTLELSAQEKENYRQIRHQFKTNWQQNQHVPSGHFYALQMASGLGGQKNLEQATEIFQELWSKYGSVPSFCQLGLCKGKQGLHDESQAILKESWSSHHDQQAGLAYGVALLHDENASAEKVRFSVNEETQTFSPREQSAPLKTALVSEAQAIFKEICEEGKSIEACFYYQLTLMADGNDEAAEKTRRLSLQSYESEGNIAALLYHAGCCNDGIGGRRDPSQAREFYKLGWEKHRDPDAGGNYAFMLYRGLGGEEDKVLAEKIRKKIRNSHPQELTVF